MAGLGPPVGSDGGALVKSVALNQRPAIPAGHGAEARPTRDLLRAAGPPKRPPVPPPPTLFPRPWAERECAEGDVSNPATPKPRYDLSRCRGQPEKCATPSATPWRNTQRNTSAGRPGRSNTTAPASREPSCARGCTCTCACQTRAASPGRQPRASTTGCMGDGTPETAPSRPVARPHRNRSGSPEPQTTAQPSLKVTAPALPRTRTTYACITRPRGGDFSVVMTMTLRSPRPRGRPTPTTRPTTARRPRPQPRNRCTPT